MHKILKRIAVAVLIAVFTFGSAGIIRAATKVNLGTADNFAILAGSTITNTGSSVITGDLGLSPGTSVTGFPPGTVSGTQHVTDGAAANAQTDLTTAYNNAAGQTSTTVPTELGGTTKTAGAYDAGTLGITGTLTLDGQGDSNAVFIFKAASTLITAGSSTVSLVNGAQACNIFWQVGSSATLGTSSTFKGTIMALTSATLTTGANVEGRVLARNGAVTLDTNTITRPTTCSTSSSATATATSTSTTTDSTSSTSSTGGGTGDSTASGTGGTDATGAGAGTDSVKLPNTGSGPARNIMWYLIPAVVVIALAGLYLVRRKRHTSPTIEKS